MTQNYRRLSATFLLITALSAGPAHSQTTDHSGHTMSGTDHSMMNHGMKPADRTAHMVEARGILVSINTETREATIRHEAIPAVSWPAAQMIFPVRKSVDLSVLQPGQSVQFTLHRAANGSLPLVELCPAQGDSVMAGLCSGAASGQPMIHGATGHHNMHHDHAGKAPEMSSHDHGSQN